MGELRVRRCLFCHARFPENRTVEQLPVGRRIALDPWRGRLWVVCTACHRWNLTPFEERWEALEALEKTRVDSGRVVASTDNIALVHAGDVEIVRVGQARLPEEAWWRYGQALTARRTRYRTIGYVEKAAILLAAATTGGFIWLVHGRGINDALRWRRFGRTAWQGEVDCIACGRLLDRLSFRQTGRLHLTRDVEGEPALHLRCRRCYADGRTGEYQLEGIVGDYVLRRVMAYHHHFGASRRRVDEATRYIDRIGSPDGVTRELSKTGIRLDHLLDRERRTQAVALEIALNDENERRLLQMDLAELEARWRRAEEIAAIVDGELTPWPP